MTRIFSQAIEAAEEAFASFSSSNARTPGGPVTELRHQVLLAARYEALAEAADDLPTFELYHNLALHHLEKAREHEADGIVVEREVKELRKIAASAARRGTQRERR